MNTSLLIGNSLAILVAAHELVSRGRHVTLMTDGKPLGAHFSGIHLQGHDFDLGMVLIEKQTCAVGIPDLETYDARIRNDWTRFGNLLAQWLEERIDLKRIPTPNCLIERHVTPDYLITNRLDAFSGIAMLPAGLPQTDDRHAAHKVHAQAYDTLSYAQATHLNHGEAFHARFIEPFVQKLIDRPSTAFLARYHRAAWAPLYYPETLSNAMRGEPVQLEEYPFWTTDNGFVGQLVQNLRSTLALHPLLRCVTSPLESLHQTGESWLAKSGDHLSCSSTQLALGISPDRAHHLLGTAPQEPGEFAAVALLFALVRTDAIKRPQGCLMLVDDDFASYRLTDQDALASLDKAWHRVVLEANPNRLARQYPALSARAAMQVELAALLQVDEEDAIQILDCITAPHALLLPTATAVRKSEAAHAAFEAAAPGVKLTAHLLGYGVASLNDQLTQGLKIAKEFA